MISVLGIVAMVSGIYFIFVGTRTLRAVPCHAPSKNVARSGGYVTFLSAPTSKIEGVVELYRGDVAAFAA